jgi:hypothetical protein
MANPTGEIGQLRDEELPAVGRGSRSGWVLSFDSDGQGHVDDYIVGLILVDIDAAVAQARAYLRSVGYPAGGWSLA